MTASAGNTRAHTSDPRIEFKEAPGDDTCALMACTSDERHAMDAVVYKERRKGDGWRAITRPCKPADDVLQSIRDPQAAISRRKVLVIREVVHFALTLTLTLTLTLSVVS